MSKNRALLNELNLHCLFSPYCLSQRSSSVIPTGATRMSSVVSFPIVAAIVAWWRRIWISMRIIAWRRTTAFIMPASPSKLTAWGTWWWAIEGIGARMRPISCARRDRLPTAMIVWRMRFWISTHWTIIVTIKISIVSRRRVSISKVIKSSIRIAVVAVFPSRIIFVVSIFIIIPISRRSLSSITTVVTSISIPVLVSSAF